VWVIRGILFLGLLFLLVYIFVSNSGQTVDLQLFGHSYLNVALFWIFAISFLLGFLISFIWASLRWLRLQRQVRKLRGLLRAHEREIAELRALPLSDMEPPEPIGGDGRE
jgi:uncharacterized integral membrane protein